MSGILNKNILEALYRANFEKITNYIIDICELVVEDYEKKQLEMEELQNILMEINHSKAFLGHQEQINYLMELAVKWVKQNPSPILLENVAYNR